MGTNFNTGKRIRFFRHLAGLSQEGLALKAGINPGFLGHLERNLKSPTIRTLEKIVSALDITLEEFFKENTPQDSDRFIAIERIHYTVRYLNANEINKIADIIEKIISTKE